MRKKSIKKGEIKLKEMNKFYLNEFLNLKEEESFYSGESQKYDENVEFYGLCKKIQIAFRNDWFERDDTKDNMIDIQKKALVGYEKEIQFFKEKIKEYIRDNKIKNIKYPDWYTSLEDGIYHETWGFAGISQWFSEKYKNSSSCKVIGDRIYFQENGQMVLKEQTIEKSRREQLIRAFLLLTPEERLDKDFHEIYALDGTRITIFSGSSVKENQDAIIFRRYIIPEYTLEEQVRRGTIPEESISFFENMIKLGYSVANTGAMKTGKTSFLATLQRYEDESLEGVMLETDPEISLHKIMPKAPILQILSKGEDLKTITKNLLRSDADYLIMAEARDGIALDTVLRMASKGTRRMKITFHSRNPMDFPQDIATEINLSLGGNIDLISKRVAKSFDYILHFVQLKDKGKKRLKGIYDISYNREKDSIDIVQICKYSYENDSWKWKSYLSENKILQGKEEDVNSLKQYMEILKKLELNNPMKN